MKSLLASIRAPGGLDRVDHAVQLLEDEWRKHGDVPLERLWAEQKRLMESDADQSIVLLSELIKTDLQCRFARDQTPAVADYLVRFPELKSADSRVLSLIYEEFCLVEERGGPVDVAAFCGRYPRWKESLVSQLQYHLFSQAAGAKPQAPPFPEAGGTFEEFHLVSLMGRGGTSRVFLARDLSLGGKQVVLKVSLDRGREPQAQGALDHPHIVPVNSVVFDDREMRGLSMPYRPGLPLDEVIKRVDPASRPRRAMALWDALVRPPEPTGDPATPKPEAPAASGTDLTGPKGDGWDGFPVRGTYPQGVAWIGKIVAGALHYAHSQQTFHRDVKPANVLLTLQHGPQLLDFNLAESPHSASQAQAAMHGGTLPYMAPEQIEAFLNPELWGKVGAQADVYSLGLVLREFLTGQAPDLPAETLAPARAMRVLLDRRPMLDVSVRGTNSKIPHALEAIVGKCLAVPPDDRYADAGALAEDLGAFLDRKPLVHAVSPSRRERSLNWTVRNKVRVGVIVACLAVFPLGMAAERWRTNGRPSGPIESSADLLAAARAIDQGRAGDALEPLRKLNDWYPHSCLPKLYLSFAYDWCRQESDAESFFEMVLGSPGARKELAAWFLKHPEVSKLLERFADQRERAARLDRADDHIVETDKERKVRRHFTLAKGALELSIEGLNDPKSQDESQSTAFKFADYEDGMGEHELAYQRANRAIKSLQSQRPADYSTQVTTGNSAYRWHWLRNRAATKLAEELRKAGTKESAERALQYMVVAEDDIHQCRRRQSATYHSEKEEHFVQGLWVDTLLTRVEIELDFGRLERAASYVKSAKNAVTTYRKQSIDIEKKEPWYLPPTYERLRQVSRSLEEARKVARESKIQPVDQNVAAGLPKGVDMP